jgi:hypothetical protein
MLGIVGRGVAELEQTNITSMINWDAGTEGLSWTFKEAEGKRERRERRRGGKIHTAQPRHKQKEEEAHHFSVAAPKHTHMGWLEHHAGFTRLITVIIAGAVSACTLASSAVLLSLLLHPTRMPRLSQLGHLIMINRGPIRPDCIQSICCCTGCGGLLPVPCCFHIALALLRHEWYVNASLNDAATSFAA